MDITDSTVIQRLVLGIVLIVIGSVTGQPNLGLETRLSAIATGLGIGFLGAAFEPLFTSALGAQQWSALSTAKQTAVLFVLSVIALVLWFAVSLAQGVLVAVL